MLELLKTIGNSAYMVSCGNEYDKIIAVLYDIISDFIQNVM